MGTYRVQVRVETILNTFEEEVTIEASDEIDASQFAADDLEGKYPQRGTSFEVLSVEKVS